MTGVNGISVFAFSDPQDFDGISGSNIAKAAGYAITTGLYVNDARNTSDYSLANFFHLQLIQILLQRVEYQEEDYGCSVGPVTLSA